jgi:signal transduction histidine kinase
MTLIAIGRETGARVRPGGVQRANLVLGLAVAVAAVAVVGFAGFGAERLWHLHTNDAPLRSAIETGITLSALFSAVLLLAHFRHTRALRDLLLLAVLATASLTDFVFNALPAYHYETGIYGAGARMASTLLMASIFAAVAFVPARRTVANGRRLLGIALPAAICWVAFGELVDLIAGPVHVQGPTGDYRPLSIAMALIAFTLLMASSHGFAERRGRGDSEAGLLAVAAVLMGAAQLSKLAMPVVPPDWVVPADALRVCAYGLLLLASVRLYRKSQAETARDALAAERRRIARDLHDGLAQDLAFIALHSERLAADYGADHPLAIAAQRALATSRGQIVDLEASHAPTTEAAIREVAAEFGSRFGVEVSVTVDRPDSTADAEPADNDRSELVRITREAIANAVRHGGAGRVDVKLGSHGADVLLRISDDGCGFAGSTGQTAGTGLGLRTMRQRALRLGAELRSGQGESGGAAIDVIALSSGAHPDL